MIDDIKATYEYATHLRARFDEHSWSRQQTAYDSKFIAYMDSRLIVLCNKIYELTQGDRP